MNGKAAMVRFSTWLACQRRDQVTENPACGCAEPTVSPPRTPGASPGRKSRFHSVSIAWKGRQRCLGLGFKSGAPQRAFRRNEASQWGWGLGRHGDEGVPLSGGQRGRGGRPRLLPQSQTAWKVFPHLPGLSLPRWEMGCCENRVS